jgi:hypothetical protein
VSSTQQVARRYFDATRGARTIRVVEQLMVRDGTIASSVFVTDMAALASFAGPERHEADERA